MRPDLFPPWLRYAVTITGLFLIVFEAVGRPGEPRWSLLVLYSGMIGVSSLLGIDRRSPPPSPPTPPPATQEGST